MDLPIDVVFARGEGIVGMPNGQRVHVRGGTHWPADDPIVRMRPDLFTRDSRFGMLYTAPRDEYDPTIVPPMDDDFESASAVPGEKRSVRRRRSEDVVL